MLVAAARDEQHLAIMRELQIKSAMIVPMIARGRTLGAMTLIGRKGRRYGDADLALAWRSLPRRDRHRPRPALSERARRQ